MVEPIRHRVVQEKGWLTQKEFMDGLALCQIVPGATVVQLATYVGYRLHKTPGAVLAAVAFILPAFFLMLGSSFSLLSIWRDLLGQISLPRITCRGHCSIAPGSLALRGKRETPLAGFWYCCLGLRVSVARKQLSPGIFGGWRPEINSWLEVFPSDWLTHRGSIPPLTRDKNYISTNNGDIGRFGPGGLGFMEP